MSLKFFTNCDNNTLENRLKDILTHYKGITHLEFLIGYFHISGFTKIATEDMDINYELYKKVEESREDCCSLYEEPLHQGAELPRQAVVQKGLSTFRNSFTSISLAGDGLKGIL